MKQIIVLTVMIACVGPAHAGSALDCLDASAQDGGMTSCLGEDAAAVTAVTAQSPTPPVTVSVQKPVQTKGSRRVPTPMGWREDEDGTATTGFYKGLNSGFKSVFAVLTLPAVALREAFESPYGENLGTYVAAGLGFFLGIAGVIVGALVGAPVGAIAGVIAEKVSPGSTKSWFTF
jgi:hypothetical protein